MPRNIAFLFSVLPFVALLATPAHAGPKTAPIYNPPPIQVPAGQSLEAVKKAVRKSLFERDWETREIGPGHLQGKHTKSGKNGDYTAVVDVKFDSKTVRITYKSSENLNYSNGSIHKTYNNWATNLERTIRGNLGAY